jgi:GT2 family glycosyltransferase
MVGVVVLNYKSDAQTIAFVNSQVARINIEKKTVIVNLAATPQSDANIASECIAHVVSSPLSIDSSKDLFLISSAENLGYAKGNNLGASLLLELFEIDYLLFSNTDIVCADENVLETLVELAQLHPEVGMIGPKILGLDGKDQSPSRYMSIWFKYTLPWLMYPFAIPLIKRGFFKDVVQGASDGPCYRVSGSFMVTSAKAFRLVGGFDPETFLYAEEEILAERMLSKGFGAFFCSRTFVIHEHGGVVRKFLSSRKSYETSFKSEMYYYSRYKGTNKITRLMACFAKMLFLNLYLPIVKTMSSYMKMWNLD